MNQDKIKKIIVEDLKVSAKKADAVAKKIADMAPAPVAISLKVRPISEIGFKIGTEEKEPPSETDIQLNQRRKPS